MIRFALAEDFGLKQLKNVQLSIDKCVAPSGPHEGTVAKSPNVPGAQIAAHTHMCQNDPYFRYICIPNWAVRDDKNEPSIILWHEYGHYLNPEIDRDCSYHIKEFPGDTPRKEINLWKENYSKRSHGDKFKEIMTRLGKPELAVAEINVSNVTFYTLTS